MSKRPKRKKNRQDFALPQVRRQAKAPANAKAVARPPKPRDRWGLPESVVARSSSVESLMRNDVPHKSRTRLRWPDRISPPRCDGCRKEPPACTCPKGKP